MRIEGDGAIAEKVPAEAWRALVESVAAGLAANGARPGAASQAAARAIEEIGTIVAPLFPRQPGDVNELPDEPWVDPGPGA